MNREILGLRLELVGLLIVLLSTVWQAAFTDWFEKNSHNWIAYIQEEVNLSVLRAIDNVSQQLLENDQDKRQRLRNKIHDDISTAYGKAINERDKRSALDAGQARIFGTIRHGLLVLGATLIVLGKWLVLQHKKGQLGSP
jgi:hypothetical protein